MRILFKHMKHNNVQHYYDKILDVDLSFYDDVFVSKCINSEFKVKIFYNHMNLNMNDVFTRFWENTKHHYQDVELFTITLFDKNDVILAEGDIFEWEEDYTKATIEFICLPCIAQLLDTKIENFGIWDPPYLYFLGNNESLSAVNKWIYDSIEDLWRRVKNKTDITISIQWDNATNYDHFVFLSQQIYDFLIQKPNPVAWFIFNIQNNNSIRDVLRWITIIFRVKLVYESNVFQFIPISIYNPEPITGYIKSVYNNERIEPEKQELVQQIWIEWGNPSSTFDFFVDGSNSVTDTWLTILNKKEHYKIWGYCGRLLVTGETILVDDKLFVIKEISYELGSLDSVKSFNAVCTLV